jgi:hypothetical protein
MTGRGDDDFRNPLAVSHLAGRLPGDALAGLVQLPMTLPLRGPGRGRGDQAGDDPVERPSVQNGLLKLRRAG